MGATLLIPIICQPHQRTGKLKDRIVLRFEALAVDCSFEIRRTLVASIGWPNNRSSISRPKGVLQDPLPDSEDATILSDFRFNAHPELCPVEEAVSAIFAKGCHVDDIRQIMPPDLTPETYKAYWKVLLSVEECQMRYVTVGCYEMTCTEICLVTTWRALTL